jgi:hypothetical protein
MDDFSKPYVPPTNRILIRPTKPKKEKIKKNRIKTLHEIHDELIAEMLELNAERERLSELPPPIPRELQQI